MLPPFVPPAARVSTESLPLITEFVADHVEHPFDRAGASFGSRRPEVAVLPSIDEFVLDGSRPRAAATEFVQRTSRNERGMYEARHEVAGTAATAPPAPARQTLEPDLLLQHHAPSGAEDAVVNEVAERADAWAASAAQASAEAKPSAPPSPALPERPEVAPAAPAAAPAAAAAAAPEVWVAEERDAFDWQAVASLAEPPAEERRAAEEWSSTEWERSGGTLQEHVAGVLAQISRRVRSGELQIQGGREMTPESVLVAVLGAMLAESRDNS